MKCKNGRHLRSYFGCRNKILSYSYITSNFFFIEIGTKLLDSVCLLGLFNSLQLIVSLNDMFSIRADHHDFLGSRFTNLFDDKTFLSDPKHEADWKRVSEHMVEAFDCLADGFGQGLSLMGG